MSEPKKTGGQPYDRWFEHYMMTGFGVSMLCFVATIIWWEPHDANTFWPAAAITLGVATLIPVVVNLFGGKGLPRLLKSLFTSLLFSSMIVGMFGFIISASLVDQFRSVDAVKEFADREFLMLNPTMVGNVESTEIDLVLKRQDEIRRALSSLDRIEKDIDALPVAGLSKELGKAGLAAPRTQLEVEKLSEPSMQRMRAAQRAIYEVGQARPAATAGGSDKQVYVASRKDFKNVRATLEAHYPLWTKVLKLLGKI